MATLEGRTLGHFRVERLIGKGGMGAVYEAVDEKLERQVALKVLLHEGDSTLNRKRFLREARLAAKLTHPNIATVFEVGEFESHLYIVMEMLEGRSLRKLLSAQRLEDDVALGIARDIARALARAHVSGVTHRDIKPENVFITTPAPQVLHAKVLDFGLARQQTDKPKAPPLPSEEHTETTAPGDVLGTPGYWSPEQARAGEIDARTDVFSFGLVLYEMITGRKAFSAKSTVALVLAVTRHEPEPIRTLVPNVSPAVEALVAKCIHKNPAQRFANGTELLEAVEALVRGSMRASNPALEDPTAVDAGGPPVARPSDVPPQIPRPPPSSPALGAPTPGPTTFDEMPGAAPAAFDRFKVAAAIGGGFALAGLLLIIFTVWPGSGRANANADPLASGAPVGSPPVVAPLVLAVPPPAAEAIAEPAPAPTTTPVPPSAPAVTMIPTPLATAAPAATTTPPRPRVDRKADCAQPFTTDAKGVKIPKLHCL